MSGLSPAVGRGVAALAALVGLVALLAWAWRALRGRAGLARVVAAAWRRLSALPAVRGSRARHPRAWAYLARRVAPAGVFGLHFTLGLAVTVLALGGFAKVADDVLDRDDLARVDAVIAGVVTAHRTPGEVQMCRVVSWVGAPTTVAVLGLVTALVLLARRPRWLAYTWVATLAGGGLLERILKAAFHRPRPLGAGAFLARESWSFPSGHAMGATVFYGMLAFLLVRRGQERGWGAGARYAVVAAAAGTVLLVGLSRVCLGVHYATDVVGAFAAGAMWLAACISGVGALGRRDALYVSAASPSASRPPTAPPVP